MGFVEVRWDVEHELAASQAERRGSGLAVMRAVGTSSTNRSGGAAIRATSWN